MLKCLNGITDLNTAAGIVELENGKMFQCMACGRAQIEPYIRPMREKARHLTLGKHVLGVQVLRAAEEHAHLLSSIQSESRPGPFISPCRNHDAESRTQSDSPDWRMPHPNLDASEPGIADETRAAEESEAGFSIFRHDVLDDERLPDQYANPITTSDEDDFQELIHRMKLGLSLPRADFQLADEVAMEPDDSDDELQIDEAAIEGM